MAIPSHQQWMVDTGLGIAKPRSQALKDLDSAIEHYGRVRTQDNLFKIRSAFEAWKRSKGGAWQASERKEAGHPRRDAPATVSGAREPVYSWAPALVRQPSW